jgi:hypothetical protein
LIFWGCLTAMLEVPVLGMIYSTFGHQLAPAAIVIGFSSLIGTCFSCALLVDHEPELARRGIMCLALYFTVVPPLLLGPITT